jgi:hypothetical protein
MHHLPWRRIWRERIHYHHSRLAAAPDFRFGTDWSNNVDGINAMSGVDASTLGGRRRYAG